MHIRAPDQIGHPMNRMILVLAILGFQMQVVDVLSDQHWLLSLLP